MSTDDTNHERDWYCRAENPDSGQNQRAGRRRSSRGPKPVRCSEDRAGNHEKVKYVSILRLHDCEACERGVEPDEEKDRNKPYMTISRQNESD